MKAIIIEDEPLERRKLSLLLGKDFPDTVEVVAEASSVEEALRILPATPCDILMMDVELSDGTCFDILEHFTPKSHLIIITAYDAYALRAFEVGSVDYLLKPLDPKDLRRAVGRCLDCPPSPIDIGLLTAVLRRTSQGSGPKDDRVMVHVDDRILSLPPQTIPCFFSQPKGNRVLTSRGDVYPIDGSLEQVYASLDGDEFFRISRGCIVSREFIHVVSKQRGRLTVVLSPDVPTLGAKGLDLVVSRSRGEEFLRWLER